MRHLLPVTVVFASLFAQGCAANCSSPQVLNGQLFQVFANQVELLSTEADLQVFTAAPAFLSYGSPANGHSKWVIDWGANLLGPVTVTIDGQKFEGSGDWDPIECGNFDLEFSGQYLADDGTVHTFATSGAFVQYDLELHGEMEWLELFTAPDGVTSGRYRAVVAVEGSL